MSVADIGTGQGIKLQDIQSWLAELGLEKYASAFGEAEIDFETLADLEKDDLNELGLPLGPRRKVWAAIQRLGKPLASPVGMAMFEFGHRDHQSRTWAGSVVAFLNPFAVRGCFPGLLQSESPQSHRPFRMP